MNSSNILSVITFVYGLAAALYVFSWVFKNKLSGNVATWVMFSGACGNAAGIILRWAESYRLGYGHAPLSNMYESLIFFSFTIAAIYLVIERKYEDRIVGAFASPLAFLALAYASLSPNITDRIQPLIPALKSNWLIAHVITCFLGYAAFAIAFVVSLMFLLRQRQESREWGILDHFPGLSFLDGLNQQMVMFGFFFLSIGIITGAVWANSAWGRYWGWDPKETWSLITWFVYATLLHARMQRGWHGKRIAYLSIVGFGAVIFTYFGVNYLPGLHSYGQSG
ncbi:MAG: c-type cytochrome biogenesis protein CcsB [Thermodesulfobacteriota bacterium]|nr:c-type cytochrome biogenesis protein CcsB [Thermodesulfobacteriota bacterium]